MNVLHAFLAHDHERLDGLLAACVRRDGSVDLQTYTEFRGGLLRHIAIEERILFPTIRSAQRDVALIDQLHRDHAALAALLVPPPRSAEIDQIRRILAEHNPLEERTNGLYEIAESVAGGDLDTMMTKIHAYPAVTLAPHVDTRVTRTSIDQLVREAEEGRRRFASTDR